jgi:long-chain acyl-CoA synthetase
MASYLTSTIKRALQVNRNGVATIDGDRERSWAEVHERVARAAGILRTLGIEPGDRVAVLALNGDRFFELHFACPWAGGVLVPCNTRLAPGEIRYVIEDSGAKILFVDDANMALLDAMPGILSEMTVVSLGNSARPGMLHYETLLAAAEPTEDVARHGSDLAAICYTGGSTGKAKGVMLSHDNLLINAINTLIMFGYDQSTVFLHAAPMFHLTDGMATYSITMAGGTHVFIPRFDADAALRAMAANKVTNVAIVPTMVEMLARQAELQNYDLSNLKQIAFGASPMPEATLRRSIKLWPHVLMCHGWGMTELSPIGTNLPPEYRRPAVAGDRLRSCGKVAFGLELRIVDETDREVPNGTVGEIAVRGPTVMMGYWNKPEETANALRGGWLHTGDAGYVDDEGFVYIVDRLKDMIISGGENVYSPEVENAISKMPGVASVAVIGVPHETWGEAVHAVVVTEPGVTLEADTVIAHCKKTIASYKSPRSVDFRTEPLPLSGAGKIFKRLLREEYAKTREKPPAE